MEVDNEILRERKPVTNVVITPKITELRNQLEKEHRRWMVKCMSCRQTAVGANINEAHFVIKHNPGCEFQMGLRTMFDSIDLSITNHF